MNFLNKLGSMFGGDGARTLVGQDRRGNRFFTIPHNRAGQPEKRVVDYHGDPDPSALHPLWKHWLSYARETVPADRDIFAWEMDQARLRKRLKEIDAASNKMQAEEMAERERGEPDVTSGFAELMARVAAQQESNRQDVQGSSGPSGSNTPATKPESRFAVRPQSFHEDGSSSAQTGPKPGENIAYENGIRVVPKEHKAYSPDPSRLQAILQKKSTTASSVSSDSPQPKQDASSPPASSWSPNAKTSTNTDDL